MQAEVQPPEGEQVKRLIFCILLLLLTGCTSIRDAAWQFRTDKQAEVTGVRFSPAHSEQRSECQSGYKMDFDGKMKWDTCAHTRYYNVWIPDRWTVKFRQCRGWTKDPQTLECKAHDDYTLRVSEAIYEEVQRTMLHRRVRSVHELVVVPR